MTERKCIRKRAENGWRLAPAGALDSQDRFDACVIFLVTMFLVNPSIITQRHLFRKH